jgi:hypothetical protein
VKTYAKENGQFISIIYNISYYRIYIDYIFKNLEEDLIVQNQHLYITSQNFIDKLNSHVEEEFNKNQEINQSKHQIGKDIIEDNLICENTVVEDTESKKDKYAIITSEPVLKFTNFSKSDILHINYGEVSFQVEEINENYIKCVALNSGVIQKFNSVSVEGKEHFSNELIVNDEEKLIRELNSAKELDVEFLVMSIIEDPNKEIK